MFYLVLMFSIPSVFFWVSRVYPHTRCAASHTEVLPWQVSLPVHSFVEVRYQSTSVNDGFVHAENNACYSIALEVLYARVYVRTVGDSAHNIRAHVRVPLLRMWTSTPGRRVEKGI